MFPRMMYAMRGGGWLIRVVYRLLHRLFTLSVQRFLAILFPVSCCVCRTECVPPKLLCPTCFNHFSLLRGDICFSCFRHPSLQPFSLCCLCWQKFLVKRVVAIGYYNDEQLRKMVGGFKYSFSFSYGAVFAQLLSEQAVPWEHFQRVLLVPIPLARRRERWRGFNQSFVFARALCDVWDCSIASLLIRNKHTPPQSQLTRLARHEHVRGLYALRPSLQPLLRSYSTVILVDDVFTTGATLQECASVLRVGGYRGVIESCVVAIEPPKHFDEKNPLPLDT